MTNDEQNDFRHELLKKVVADLGEHFDTIQIFATHHDPAEQDGTVAQQTGVGNYYARYGQVQEWMIMQDEEARIKRRTDDDDDED